MKEKGENYRGEVEEVEENDKGKWKKRKKLNEGSPGKRKE